MRYVDGLKYIVEGPMLQEKTSRRMLDVRNLKFTHTRSNYHPASLKTYIFIITQRFPVLLEKKILLLNVHSEHHAIDLQMRNEIKMKFGYVNIVGSLYPL